MKVKDILAATGGKLVSGNPGMEVDLAKVSTDTRLLKKGDFFIALTGANYDASEFVEEAFKKGAIGAITAGRKFGTRLRDKILITVKDTTKALQDIASAHRLKFDIPVICVTGSNGKTTVKEMIWKVLSAKYNVLKNEGTKNNHIGVPQTILKLNEKHNICVLEIGMNHKGEIRLLSRIARPTVAVMTNIGPSHLGFLGSLKAIYEAKKEILENLEEGGVVILNGDDPFLSKIKDGRFRTMAFGLNRHNELRAGNIILKKGGLSFTVNDKMKFKLKILGIHNVYNALAAIAVGNHFRVAPAKIRIALSKYEPSYMRLNVLKVGGITVINDSYNSNPLSMRCALSTLKTYPARSRWVVSGDMLELGRMSGKLHEEIGFEAAKTHPAGLIVLGKFSGRTVAGARKGGMGKKSLWKCESHDEIADVLNENLMKGDAVLIKGSRGMKMENIIAKIRS